jgi:hypothetical protein
MSNYDRKHAYEIERIRRRGATVLKTLQELENENSMGFLCVQFNPRLSKKTKTPYSFSYDGTFFEKALKKTAKGRTNAEVILNMMESIVYHCYEGENTSKPPQELSNLLINCDESICSSESNESSESNSNTSTKNNTPLSTPLVTPINTPELTRRREQVQYVQQKVYPIEFIQSGRKAKTLSEDEEKRSLIRTLLEHKKKQGHKKKRGRDEQDDSNEKTEKAKNSKVVRRRVLDVEECQTLGNIIEEDDDEVWMHGCVWKNPKGKNFEKKDESANEQSEDDDDGSECPEFDMEAFEKRYSQLPE